MSTLKMVLLGMLVFLTHTATFATEGVDLLPVPKEIKFVGGKFRLTKDFTIGLQGAPTERLANYATRALRRLSGRTGLFFPQDFIKSTTIIDTAYCQISISRASQLQLNEDESYQLIITPSQITLTAATDLGAMRGLETLLQLLGSDQSGYFFPGVIIEDAPRFTWRGLLIDVSRHFMPLEVIKRNLDGMAAVKLNVLHWHLVDDQGFRVECRTFPKLHQLASDGFYYTQQQIKEVIAYAAERGIRIVPEFDVPAHATAWCVAYPELASAPGPYQLQRLWGIFDPTLDPTRETTYQFLDQFFQEMAQLFEDDYIHIGGDENNHKQWKTNPAIQVFMQQNNIPDYHQLQRYFNQRVLQILTKHGKKMIGWDEIFQPGLPKDIVVHCWRDRKYLEQPAEQGYMGILSNGYYVDLIQSAEYHYLNDPIPSDTKLSAAAQKLILGGEATSWGELVTPETIDSRIWPRTAAIAERLWSPANVRDVDDMYRRLEIISLQLEELGLTHRTNYEMMLRRLVKGDNIQYLKNFVDLVEPVKLYQRHFQGVIYTAYSPYTRVVDAARPESIPAHRLQKLVNTYLEKQDPQTYSELKHILTDWAQNHEHLLPIIEKSPILWEIRELSAASAELAQVSILALEQLHTKNKPNPKFKQRALQAIETARKPAGQVELAIVKPLEQLIQAACR